MDKGRVYRSKPLPAKFLATDGFLGRGVIIHRCAPTVTSSILMVTRMALGKQWVESPNKAKFMNMGKEPVGKSGITDLKEIRKVWGDKSDQIV